MGGGSPLSPSSLTKCKNQIAVRYTPFDLFRVFSIYYDTALRLRSVYSSQIHLLVGFEAEYIRPSSIELIRGLQLSYKFDFFVGSVHHVNAIPIDFDRALYIRARESTGGGEDALFSEYFDVQYRMLRELKPAVVGHFDLVRLMADSPRKRLREYGDAVWGKVRRNLRFVASYGGLVELNSASLRKGWDTPYPAWDVCEEFIAIGGRFTLSDDSHGVEQVGLNYGKVLRYLEQLRLERIYYLEKLPGGEVAVDMLDACAVRSMTVEELKRETFWGPAGVVVREGRR